MCAECCSQVRRLAFDRYSQEGMQRQALGWVTGSQEAWTPNLDRGLGNGFLGKWHLAPSPLGWEGLCQEESGGRGRAASNQSAVSEEGLKPASVSRPVGLEWGPVAGGEGSKGRSLAEGETGERQARMSSTTRGLGASSSCQVKAVQRVIGEWSSV